jgi:hypothetical protein
MYRIILLRGSTEGLRLSKNLVTVKEELPAAYRCLQITQDAGALLKQNVPVAMLNTYRKVLSILRCCRLIQVMIIVMALHLPVAIE